MSIREKHSLRRWGMTGLVGLMALSLAACGKISQDGSSGNRAGKNFYIQSFAPWYTPSSVKYDDDTGLLKSSDLTSNTCPPTTGLAYSGAYLNISTGDVALKTLNDSIWAIVQNDMTAGTTATAPENQVVYLDNIHVEYEVAGGTAILPSYDERIATSVSPGGGKVCYAFHVFPQQTRDYINKNRSAFPRNETSNNSFHVRAKVKAMGYETNGGQRVESPSVGFNIHVYD